ncbi:MAG: hypothetical protein KAI29_31130 [Cyclobacteriaceae bacterium]|nr:hypothetical protein [Cyclobacteriaceae bacterium]
MKKGFLITLLNNFSIVFTIIGITATIYLSCFFIPDYLVEKEESKIKGVSEELISDLSKLLISGNEIELSAINSMIKGKEIKAGIEYPYSIKELLIQTQESVFANELIPGEVKNLLNLKLEDLLTSLSNTTSYDVPEEKKEALFKKIIKNNKVKIYLVASLGILLSLFGIYSLYYQYHLNKRVYLKSLFEENKVALEQHIRVNLNFELVVANALKSLKMKYNAFIDKQNKADLNLKTESGKTIYIKSRHWQIGEQIDQDFIEKFIQLVVTNKANGIFITNIENKQALTLFDEHNKNKSNYKIYMIVGDTMEELKAMLMNSMNRIEKEK